ncbi:hypothetical protein BKA62DRAFT_712410, partial [Auriculariales sp. MPI-PUGE-AT-0066]
RTFWRTPRTRAPSIRHSLSRPRQEQKFSSSVTSSRRLPLASTPFVQQRTLFAKISVPSMKAWKPRMQLLLRFATRAKLPARLNIFNGRDDSVNAIATLICAGLCPCIAIMGSGGIRSSLSRHASEGFRVPSIIDSTCVRRIQSTVDTTRAEVQFVSHVVQETAVGVDTIRTTTDAVHKDIGAVHEGVGATHRVVTEIRDEVKMMSREKKPTM